MILTCPSCSTRYNVGDTSLGENGRTVRCASCGHSWFQKKPEDVAADSMLLRVASAAPKVFAPKAPAGPPPPPHTQARAKAHAKIKAKHFAYAASAWALAGALMIGVIGTALAYRVDIVKLWPKSASAFAAIGMPANLYGLVIESETVRSGSDASGPRLLVAGIVRNVTSTEKPMPYLRVSLQDEHGKELATWFVDAGKPSLVAGEKHAFMTEYPKPPAGARKVEISFADEPDKATAEPAEAPAKDDHGGGEQSEKIVPPSAPPEDIELPSDAEASGPVGAAKATPSQETKPVSSAPGAPIPEDAKPVRQAAAQPKPKPRPKPAVTPPAAPEALPKSFIRNEPAASPAPSPETPPNG
jgi:predicted Zn finger-like uncharacterized protein